ncbi:MAG: PD40 domain-containing protein [Cyclobacteriaceae bacterium]|nr:PD40 domain-containing protein [Cyclobacteriaceae bacterium]
MKRISLLICLFVTCSALHSSAQTPMRKLPQNINRPTINVSAPFISLDGSTLLFTSDYAEDNVPSVYYVKKVGPDWQEPVALPKHINTKLNFLKGYTLSADGKTIYISSIKSGGVGGFDIWAGGLKGNSWSDLQNMYAPINSKLHEASPTFTPDGTTMYFMRCEKMDAQRAERCKIMVSKKSATGRWEEPTELPAHINTGNSQTPRISADGSILIFSSNAMSPNKGGMDLYVSRLENGVWSNPEAMDFVNTEKDDQFVSAVSNGRYLMKDAPGKFKSEIIEYLVPAPWRPRAVMKVDGQILGQTGAPIPAYISVTDLATHKRFFSGRPDKEGNYFLYLTQGSKYELAIDPEESNFTFFSKVFDMTVEESPLVQQVSTVLKPVAAGDEIELEGILFKPHSTEPDDIGFEIVRLSRLIKNSPQLKFDIHVSLLGYFEDEERSHPDLSEVSIDSVIIQLDDIDSLGQLYSRDSVVVKASYHNNRTEKQALAVIDQLVAAGVDRGVLVYSTSIKPEAILENRRTLVRVKAKSKN